jgi:hypothetical protein
MASAGSAALTTGVSTIFNPANDGGECRMFWIQNDPTSTNIAQINIAGLHKPGEFLPLGIGKDLQFKDPSQGIGIITAKTLAGTATLNFGVVEG